MVAEVSRPAAGALWCNSAPWLTNLEAFSITYFAASRAGLWTVCSTANRVWRGGNRTHMFSRHRVFVSCQRHVCSLCVNVTPSVRMSVASVAGENWLRRNEKLTFFFLFFFLFLSRIGIFWYDFRGVVLSTHALMQRGDYFTLGAHPCCFTWLLKNAPFRTGAVETGEKYRWQTGIQAKESIRLLEAELCRPRSGELRPIPQAKYWLKV